MRDFTADSVAKIVYNNIISTSELTLVIYNGEVEGLL